MVFYISLIAFNNALPINTMLRKAQFNHCWRAHVNLNWTPESTVHKCGKTVFCYTTAEQHEQQAVHCSKTWATQSGQAPRNLHRLGAKAWYTPEGASASAETWFIALMMDRATVWPVGKNNSLFHLEGRSRWSPCSRATQLKSSVSTNWDH